MSTKVPPQNPPPTRRRSRILVPIPSRSWRSRESAVAPFGSGTRRTPASVTAEQSLQRAELRPAGELEEHLLQRLPGALGLVPDLGPRPLRHDLPLVEDRDPVADGLRDLEGVRAH